MAKAKRKTKRITSVSIRENAKKDHSPVWDGHEKWTQDQFSSHFHAAMQYYNIEYSAKDLKPQIIRWMERDGFGKKTIEAFKQASDSQITVTMGALASNLLKGMPAVRKDFNHGQNSADWLKQRIQSIVETQPKAKKKDEQKEDKKAPFISIQDRVKESAYRMTEGIEDAWELWQTDPDKFEPSEHKALNILKVAGAKAPHARIIREAYAPQLAEFEELSSGNADEQLREGYSHRSKKTIRKMIEFLKDVESACIMLAEEAKVTRKPRARKALSKEKIIAKLKYKKTDDALKLVSVNPADIIGSKELWVYNVKTRKLGKYVAAEYSELNIKGTSITDYNENLSVQKTLRKPAEQLKEFKNAGKVQLRKFLEDIKAIDIKLNGRINQDVVLLKVL